MTDDELAIELSRSVAAFNLYVDELPADVFELEPNGKWSAGQNLSHLVRAIQAIQLGFSVPLFLLKMFYGKSNRPSRSYEELRSKYKSKLAVGGRATGRFVPGKVSIAGKASLINRHLRLGARLQRRAAKLTEHQMEHYLLPHPLLGKLTMKEMLMFQVMHVYHHLELLKNR
jgi:hypothetical protein